MEFNQIIDGHLPAVQQIAIALRKLMLDSHSDISEKILGGKKIKMAYYFVGDYNNAVGVIGTAKDHCKLFLHHTDHINTAGLQLEGKGKHAKHVKIFSLDEIQQNSIYSEYIKKIALIAYAKMAN